MRIHAAVVIGGRGGGPRYSGDPAQPAGTMTAHKSAGRGVGRSILAEAGALKSNQTTLCSEQLVEPSLDDTPVERAMAGGRSSRLPTQTRPTPDWSLFSRGTDRGVQQAADFPVSGAGKERAGSLQSAGDPWVFAGTRALSVAELVWVGRTAEELTVTRAAGLLAVRYRRAVSSDV